jgi:hypothetical protein
MTNIFEWIMTYKQGVVDGLEEPYDLSCGMTYSDERNEIYDRGANMGQWIGRIWAEIRRGPSSVS